MEAAPSVPLSCAHQSLGTWWCRLTTRHGVQTFAGVNAALHVGLERSVVDFIGSFSWIVAPSWKALRASPPMQGLKGRKLNLTDQKDSRTQAACSKLVSAGQAPMQYKAIGEKAHCTSGDACATGQEGSRYHKTWRHRLVRCRTRRKKEKPRVNSATAETATVVATSHKG